MKPKTNCRKMTDIILQTFLITYVSLKTRTNNSFMKATVYFDNLASEAARCSILRNISRIMDVKVVEIDLHKQALSFLCVNHKAVEKVKSELKRLGFPVKKVFLPRQQGKPKRSPLYGKWDSDFE